MTRAEWRNRYREARNVSVFQRSFPSISQPNCSLAYECDASAWSAACRYGDPLGYRRLGNLNKLRLDRSRPRLPA